MALVWVWFAMKRSNQPMLAQDGGFFDVEAEICGDAAEKKIRIFGLDLLRRNSFGCVMNS